MDKNRVSKGIVSDKVLHQDEKTQRGRITNAKFLPDFIQVLETTSATIHKEPIVGSEFVPTEEVINKELERYQNLLESRILETVDCKNNKSKIKLINKK